MISRYTWSVCLRILVTMLFIIGAGYVIWLLAIRPGVMPIRRVVVVASSAYFPVEPVQKTIEQQLQRGGLIFLPARFLRQQLLALPWIKAAVLRRKWPDTLLITIKERKPVARFNKRSVLTQGGQVIAAPAGSDFSELCQIDMPETGVKNVGAVVLNDLTHFSQLAKKVNLSVRNLSLNQTGQWSLILSNGIVVYLGDHTILQRFTRFIALYPNVIGDNGQAVESVSLQYDTGFAIKWKKMSKIAENITN